MRKSNVFATFLSQACALCCALAVVAGAAFAVALLVSPGEAYADDVTVITQDSFTDNVLTINSGGTYQLGEDVTGSILIWSSSDGVTLDLNGKTLTCPSGMSENDGCALYINKPEGFLATYVVKNGTIVQNNVGHDAIHIYWQHFSKSMLLEDLTVTAHNASCLSTDTSNTDNSNSTRVSGGSYTTTNDEGVSKPTMYAHAATIVIKDGAKVILSGDGDVVKHDSSDGQITLEKGSYSKPPLGTKVTLAEGYVVFKSGAEGSAWKVMTEDEARLSSLDGGNAAGWSVAVDGFGTVYFDTESEAAAFAAEKGSEVGTVAVARMGETYYLSLKAAVAAASSGETVQLLADTTESVSIGKGASVSIDLGGKTLTAPDSSEAISKTGSGTVSISNGTISSKGSCVIVGSGSAAAVVTLDGVNATSTSTSAVNCATGTVNIKGGTISGIDTSNGYAIAMGSDARINVSGGSLTGGTGIDISRGTATHITVSGGDFGGVVNVADYLASGKSLSYEDGRYRVVDSGTDEEVEALRAASRWVLTTSGGNKVYYGANDESRANADKDKLSDSTLNYIYHASFIDYKGKTVKTLGRISGEQLGTLPSGEREGYAFKGWYDDTTRAEETTVVSTDVEYTGKWVDTAAPVISGLETGKAYEGTTTFMVTDDSGFTVEAGGVALNPNEGGAYTLSEETLAGVPEGGVIVSATDENGNSSSVKISWYKSHDWSEWSDAADGINHSRHCGNCGKVEKAAHELSWVTTAEPTYTTKGHKHQVCGVCGYTCNETDIDPLTPDAPVVTGIEEGGVYEGEVSFTVTSDLPIAVSAGNTILGVDQDEYTLSEETLAEEEEGELTVTVSDTVKFYYLHISWYKGHAWGAWSPTEDGDSHTRTCSHCGKTETGEHSGGTATCESPAICEECGAAYGEKDPANHAGPISADWASDDDNHWHVCEACGGEVEVTEHTLVWVTDREATATEDGLRCEECSVCGHKTGNTEVIPRTGGDGDGSDEDGSSDEGGSDEKNDGSDDGSAIPQTGDLAAAASAVAVAGAALASIGVLRRRR